MTWNGPLEQVRKGIHAIPKSYRGETGKLTMGNPGHLVASSHILAHIREDRAAEQVANVASLPGIVGPSLAMPDIHYGYGFPIGGVAAFDATEGIVSPGGVGFDINCGVRFLAFDLTVEELQKDLESAADLLAKVVPAGLAQRGRTRVGTSDVFEVCANGAEWAVQEGYLDSHDVQFLEESGRLDGDPSLLSSRAIERGRRGLGSLGSGNHFLEIQSVESILETKSAQSFGLEEGMVGVMIHSGSRGLGHQVCQESIDNLVGTNPGIIDEQLCHSPINSDAGQNYLSAMAAAANFGFANRSILASTVMDVFEELFSAGGKTVWDVCHNIAKFEEHVDPLHPTESHKVLVHRKGATRAFPAGHEALPDAYSQTGQPILVPGDMGRASFILAASAGAMTESFGSSCHGAGRKMSRHGARKLEEGGALIQRLWEERGIIVKATNVNVAAEEAPDAYKDVSHVVESIEAANIARRVAKLRPWAVIKG